MCTHIHTHTRTRTHTRTHTQTHAHTHTHTHITYTYTHTHTSHTSHTHITHTEGLASEIMALGKMGLQSDLHGLKIQQRHLKLLVKDSSVSETHYNAETHYTKGWGRSIGFAI